ncbi:MAG: tripartite tricarboxylate transporter substrate binding protein [Betaproteobacteria bacterium]|nr:tripartite tricarboxylate transporter substrate binding protein [Betaproteobacteria bacterium]
MNQPIFRFTALMVALLSSATSQAQWSKPLRFYSTNGAGDATDLILRRVSADLAPRIGQSLIVENRPGANGIIAAEAYAKAGGDGHTLCHVNPSAMSFNPHLRTSLPYDVERDFRPLTNMYFLIGGVFVRDAVPVNSMAALQAYVTANPGKLDFATLGPNVSVDLFRQWLNDQWKSQIVGIPYKGSGPLMNALSNGEVHGTWIAFFSVLGLIKAGKLRVLAVDTTRRSPLFPDVPTLAEAGMPDSPAVTWHGLVMPAATADATVRRLNAEIVRLFAEPAYEEMLNSRMLLPATSSPEEFGAYLKNDRARAGEVVRKFNLPRQ